MTSTAAFDMAMVHRVFRNELHGVPELIDGVRAGDAKRAAVVNASELHRCRAASPSRSRRRPDLAEAVRPGAPLPGRCTVGRQDDVATGRHPYL